MQTIPAFAVLCRHWTALMLCIACSAVGAQTAYRCTVGNRTVYQAAPCDGGIALQVDDNRSEAQRAEARHAQERLESTGVRMAKEKEARDRALSASTPRVKPSAKFQTATGEDSVPRRQSKPSAPLKFKIAPPKTPTADTGSQPRKPKRAALP